MKVEWDETSDAWAAQTNEHATKGKSFTTVESDPKRHPYHGR